MPSLPFQAGRHGWGLAPSCPQLSDDRFPKANQAFFMGLQEERSLFVKDGQHLWGQTCGWQANKLQHAWVSHWHSPTAPIPGLVGILACLNWVFLKGEDTFSLVYCSWCDLFGKKHPWPLYLCFSCDFSQCKAYSQAKTAPSACLKAIKGIIQ